MRAQVEKHLTPLYVGSMSLVIHIIMLGIHLSYISQSFEWFVTDTLT